MSKCCFIKVGAAIGTATVVSAAYAGDVTRYDLTFAMIDYSSTSLDPASPFYTMQTVATGDAGRDFGSFGVSNADVDVCWNEGSDYESWASECSMGMTMSDGTDEGIYGLTSVFPGQDTGAAAVGECVNFLAPDELNYDLPPATYFVPASGDVEAGVYSAWDDGTGMRNGTVNNLEFYFTLAAAPPAGCDGAVGGCAEVHSTPGCDDLSCCTITCDPSLGGDTFCCEVEWDSSCVDLAVALCGIFQYECETTGASPANDCATAPSMAENGVDYAFDTTNANTDGPDEVGCGSAEEDLPVWYDVWYMVDIDSDAVMTATCCLTAQFDTKIAIYDAGPSGSTFDPTTLPDVFIICNEDCDDPEYYSSEAAAAVTGGNQYLVRLGGYAQATGTGIIRMSWEEPAPPIEEQTCLNPGSDPVSQASNFDLTVGGVACAGGGITTENNYARTYTKAELGGGPYVINCVNFGRTNSGSYIEGAVNFYRDGDAGVPGPMGDMELLASIPVGLGSTDALWSSASFGDNPLCVDLADGENLVIEIAAGASLDGWITTMGGGAASNAANTTYIRSGPCGITEYLAVDDIGFADNQWTVQISGSYGCDSEPSCPGDFNDDGVVDGADFGSMLASWGACPSPCPQDLNNDGSVNGADIGLMLSVWGDCPG
jgi:hypothetical protein